MSADSVHVAQLLRFAAGNAARDWRRGVVPLLAVAGLAFAGAVAGPGSLLHHLERTEARRRDGALVVVAESDRGLDAGACERLVLSSGVLRAGSSTTLGATQIRPGVPVADVAITPGLQALLFDGPHDLQPDDTVLGDGLADRLQRTGADDGETVLPGSGNRTEFFSAAAVVVHPAFGLASRCEIETTPAGFATGVDEMVAALSVTAPDLHVRTLTYDAGPLPFDAMPSNLAPLVGGSFAGVIIAMLVALRRIDLALYRVAGFRRRHAWLIVFCERSLQIVVGSFAGALAWTTAAGLTRRLPRAVVLAQCSAMVLSTVAALVVTAAAVAVCNRKTLHVAVLREGA